MTSSNEGIISRLRRGASKMFSRRGTAASKDSNLEGEKNIFVDNL